MLKTIIYNEVEKAKESEDNEVELEINDNEVKERIMKLSWRLEEKRRDEWLFFN